jgi:acetyl esterase/lipase
MMKTITFAEADGEALSADLYLPEGEAPFPLVIGISGGGWARGNRGALAAWGKHLAKAGLAFASIDYRRASARPIFPGNAEDVAAALRFFSISGEEHSIDTRRIGLLGVSAGGHLGALVSLSDEFDCPQPKVFAGIYGVYDLLAHWQADRDSNSVTAFDKTERMLGAKPFADPQLYHRASPLRQITYERSMPVFLCWGHLDRDVAPEQSAGFARALRQAGYPVTAVELPDAPHLWFSEETPEAPGSFSARVAPALIRFLKRNLAAPAP